MINRWIDRQTDRQEINILDTDNGAEYVIHFLWFFVATAITSVWFFKYLNFDLNNSKGKHCVCLLLC